MKTYVPARIERNQAFNHVNREREREGKALLPSYHWRDSITVCEKLSAITFFEEKLLQSCEASHG